MADECTPRRHDPRRDAERARLRGMPEDRQRMGASAALPHLRPCRLLRRFAQQARHRAFPRDPPSGHRRLRPAGRLGLVLCRRDVPRPVGPTDAAGRPDPEVLLGNISNPSAKATKFVLRTNHKHALMANASRQDTKDLAQRSGSADLPLHGGRVPKWLGDRMTRLGAVMCEAIVHHYGRDELLRRLAHPFWFQSFGAVMGMDWHSSGITTSVIGALEARAWRRSRANSAFTSAAAAARIRARRRTSWSPSASASASMAGAGNGEPAGRQGRQRRRPGRLRPLSARLHRHRRRQNGSWCSRA